MSGINQTNLEILNWVSMIGSIFSGVGLILAILMLFYTLTAEKKSREETTRVIDRIVTRLEGIGYQADETDAIVRLTQLEAEADLFIQRYKVLAENAGYLELEFNTKGKYCLSPEGKKLLKNLDPELSRKINAKLGPEPVAKIILALDIAYLNQLVKAYNQVHSSNLSLKEVIGIIAAIIDPNPPS